MIIEIDVASAVPPYEQLRSQLAAMVEARMLAPGDRLPSIRQLANDLDLAGGTVARAYRELEAAGVVETRGRHGTIVAAPPTDAAVGREPAGRDDLVAAARQFLGRVQHLGVEVESAIAVVRLVATDPGGTRLVGGGEG